MLNTTTTCVDRSRIHLLNGPGADSTRPLNAADRCLMAVDRTIRRLGGPGFETQTFIWLNDRIDARSLAARIASLSERFPLITARLVEQGGPFWRLRPAAAATLDETLLNSAGPQTVLDEAARLLSAPTDPAEVDPVRFHLFHRPDGSDVLLIQYNHTLLDHHDAILLLRQLNDDPLTADAQPTPPRQRWGDPIWNHLRHVPRARRRAAALAAERWRQSLRGGAVRLARQHPAGGPVSFGIAARRLEPAQTISLRTHIIRCCGVPSLSMGVLASAFRAINRLAGAAPVEYLSAGIGVDLGLTRGGSPAMQNLTTLVPIQVAAGALGDVSDRDDLIRTLSQQLRARLANDMDVGVLELAAIFGRRQHQAQWAIELLFRYCASLWYGSFGPLRGLGPAFCGATIEQAFSAGPAWPPVGITLLVNEFAGRLHLQATYVRQCVPDSLANAFLDAVLSDFDLPNGVA